MSSNNAQRKNTVQGKNTVKGWMAILALLPGTVWAMGDTDPLMTTWTLDQLEWQRPESGDETKSGGETKIDSETESAHWKGELAVGYDLNKLRLKSEGEWHDNALGDTETRLLWSHAVAPYWDLTLGAQAETLEQDRQWLEVGVLGTAWYFIDSDIALLLGDAGRSGVRVDLEKEFMLTQRWYISAEWEAEFYAQSDEENLRGAGFSASETSLSVGYQWRREFTTYMGVRRSDYFGDTRALLKSRGDNDGDTQWVVGVRAWY